MFPSLYRCFQGDVLIGMSTNQKRCFQVYKCFQVDNCISKLKMSPNYVSKLTFTLIQLFLEYKKRAPTFVRLAMRRTSSALGLDVMRRNKANNNFLVKEDNQEFHLGPFTMTKKIEH